MERKVTTVRYWIDRDAWYAEALNKDGDAVIDSQKINFPVDVDQHDLDDGYSLHQELVEAFPGAEVVRRPSHAVIV